MFSADRLRAAIEAVIRALGPAAEYLAAWPGTVAWWEDSTQRADVAIPAGPFAGTMRALPIVVDPPGTRITLELGTDVLVSFRGGDPAQPYVRPAAAFGAGAFVPAAVGLANGGPAVARVGDSVGVGELILAPLTIGGVPVPWHRAPGGVWAPVSSQLTPPLPTDYGTALDGEIRTGSGVVSCG